MASIPELRTERLLLRAWRDEDLAPFAAINADPIVMEYFVAPLSRAESDERVARIRADWEEQDFGLWAVEVPEVAPFTGFVGLAVPSFNAAFTPCVEIGWRLGRQYWGRGYATEAARATLGFAFDRLGLEEVVALTAPANARSRRVMERIGMHHSEADDFDHPKLPEGHEQRRHVLYRIGRPVR